jgi:hypothetical protein
MTTITKERLMKLSGLSLIKESLGDEKEIAMANKLRETLKSLTNIFVSALESGARPADLSLICRTAIHEAYTIVVEKEAQESKHELGEPRF